MAAAASLAGSRRPRAASRVDGIDQPLRALRIVRQTRPGVTGTPPTSGARTVMRQRGRRRWPCLHGGDAVLLADPVQTRRLARHQVHKARKPCRGRRMTAVGWRADPSLLLVGWRLCADFCHSPTHAQDRRVRPEGRRSRMRARRLIPCPRCSTHRPPAVSRCARFSRGRRCMRMECTVGASLPCLAAR